MRNRIKGNYLDSEDDAGYHADVSESDSDDACFETVVNLAPQIGGLFEVREPLFSSIYNSIQRNNAAELTRLLIFNSKDLSVDRLNEYLLFSIRLAQVDCVTVLINQGADINAAIHFSGDTVSPFYMAAFLTCYDSSSGDGDSARILALLIQLQCDRHGSIESVFNRVVVQSQVELQTVKASVLSISSRRQQ